MRAARYTCGICLPSIVSRKPSWFTECTSTMVSMIVVPSTTLAGTGNRGFCCLLFSCPIITTWTLLTFGRGCKLGSFTKSKEIRNVEIIQTEYLSLDLLVQARDSIPCTIPFRHGRRGWQALSSKESKRIDQ